MFLDWVAQLKLLQHEPETNIINGFPLVVQRVMVTQVVQSLLDQSLSPATVLPTGAHVKWVMECVGQGFRLPVNSDHAIITQCIDLYFKWIQGERRPAWIANNLEAFVLAVAKHMSLLFENRSKGKEEIASHASLCQKVLTVFVAISKLKLSTETFEIVIKLLVGMTDSVFQSMDEGSLGRCLAERILQVLYEVWLRSLTTNDNMWNVLRKLHENWLNFPETISQWSSTIISLTHTLIDRLYKNKPNAALQMTAPIPTGANIDMPDEHAHYAWQRIFHIIVNVNLITQPNIFVTALAGIKLCCQTFSDIQGANLPDGNTVLNLFGECLFEAAIRNRPGFESGTALAIENLCFIFNRWHPSEFSNKYVACFIRSLQVALQTDPGLVMTSCLVHSQGFFIYELMGFRSLIPFYMRAVEIILAQAPSAIQTSSVPADVLRRSCLHVVASVMSLPSRFAAIQFPFESSRGDPNLGPILAYSDLEVHIGQILLTALNNETHATNIQYILQIAQAFVSEFLPPASPPPTFSITQPQSSQQCAAIFMWSFLYLMEQKISTPGWNPDVMSAGIRVVTDLSGLYTNIEKNEEFALRLVCNLCDLVKDKLSKYQPGAKDDERLISDCYRCILHWLMVPDQWVYRHLNCLSTVLETAHAGITQKAGAKKPEKDKKELLSDSDSAVLFKDAALSTLLFLNNHLGSYPTAAGAERVSSIITEEMLLPKDGKAPTSQFVRLFGLEEGLLLCIVDVPSLMEGGLTSTCIVRDRTGKYVWQSRLQYLPYSEQGQHAVRVPDDPNLHALASHPFKSDWFDTSMLTDEGMQDLYAFLSSEDNNTIIRMVHDTVNSQTQYLAGAAFGLDIDVKLLPPVCHFDGTNPASSVAWTHFGHFTSTTRFVAQPLELSSNLWAAIKQFDQQPERETMQIGVVFVEANQRHEDEIFANTGGSNEFNMFVRSLGWEINLASHTGFLGGLDRKQTTGTWAPYYANFESEVIFHVATIIPNLQHKKRLINRDLVLVVWAEDIDFDAQNMSNQFKIIINPLPSGVFRVKTVWPQGTTGIAHSEEVILSKNSLGAIIRAKSMHAHRLVHVSKPYVFA
eukprot:TRINITY_DN3158_c0_g1_i1.p1 TRINITY_DN3158_c0_g1~~TRINITY_DN3158_c0_g1_i1.p1  ORF type:complete len:1086 (-),score=189.19 TRINITY_DN3158_c0_g1_i1:690-3947(-)